MSQPDNSAPSFEIVQKKRCSTCKKWKPATSEFFYPTTSRGKRVNQWGEPYLRGECRVCKLDRHAEWVKTQPERTEEEKDRYAKMQRARRRAYQRLAKVNEEGFKLLYAEELWKEGIKLDHYVGPTLREDTARVHNDKWEGS